VGRVKRGVSKLYSEELSVLYIKLNIVVYEGRGKSGVCKLHSEYFRDLNIKLNINV
jgi:hypothetical protein